MGLTRHELDGHATFSGDAAFRLHSCPFPGDIPLGLYELPRRSGEAHLYRLTHPLAAAVIARAKSRELPPAELAFDYGAHEGKISLLEPLIGASGFLSLSLFTVETADEAEDHLLVASTSDDGTPLDDGVAQRLLTLPARVLNLLPAPDTGDGAVSARLAALTNDREQAILASVSERNAGYFEQEMRKLDAWADDRRLSLRRTLKELDEEIQTFRKQARQAGNLPDQLALRRKMTQAEARRDEAETEFRAATREITQQKNDLIDAVELRLKHQASRTPLFEIRWRLT
ncbi:MAG: DEAD/DEAH box helicase [Chloroflexota bacterium]|nr:DEAD/DEAH box helicase [Chloroflexota bacterium]